MTSDEMTLVREYAQSNSEHAFATLVSRHVNLVYSVALRQVHNPNLAEEITQSVFIILARKAKSLSPNTILSGWLCRTARNVSADTLKIQRRRQFREQESHMQSLLNEPDSTAWNQIEPLLDEALNCLGEKEHDAVVLRFFDGKELKQVGAAMRTTEDAARMRVNRGVEKMRDFFTKRGVTLSATAVAGAVAANSVYAAPAGLAGSVAAAALASAAAGGGITATLVELMTMTKLKVGIISVLAVAVVATQVAIQNQSKARLREANEALRQQANQLAQVAVENERLSNLLVQAKSAESLSREQMSELLRLRGQVVPLRRDAQELVQLKAAVSKAQDGASAPPEPSDPERMNQMVRWLNQNPSEKTPELKLLSATDWLKAIRGKLDTEGDYRFAASELRGFAELNQLVPALYGAVKQYAQAQNGQFPTDISQLKPYFTSPIDDAILQRYQILPASNLSHLLDASEVGVGGEWVITQKAPINEIYDSRIIIGPTNFIACLQTNRWVITH